MGHDIGHLLLYAIGLVLTFNMGRDITLLVIYPFVFGWLILWWNNRRKQGGPKSRGRASRAQSAISNQQSTDLGSWWFGFRQL
jgi:hypothetical protein